MNNQKLIQGGIVFVLIAVIGYFGVWKWGMSRIYVEPGHMLVVTSKFGEENADPNNIRVVEEGTKGILREVRGEGRYFYNPLMYEADSVSTIVEIKPNQVGVVKSKSGKPLAEGQFLVRDKENSKGILERPLTPGKWRLNPYHHTVETRPATLIKPGFVGCVTAQAGVEPPHGQLAGPGERGVRKEVLQPGIYYLNPHEYSVESVEVGYRQITLKSVKFPSRDAFAIQLDISVVWGLHPENVPKIINKFGNVTAVVEKIIRPQVESICRIEGGKYGAKGFIEGTTREKFQKDFTDQLEVQARRRNIEILIGLVREVSVPIEVRTPIQEAKIADEEQKTKIEQGKTQTVKNELAAKIGEVLKGVAQVDIDTKQHVAQIGADGDREIAKVRADMKVAVAEIMKKYAEVEAKRNLIKGEAKAEGERLMREAEADLFKQNVTAMGNSEAYAHYIFAMGLPDDLRIDMRYAGPGTFWTDLPAGTKMLESAAVRKILTDDQEK